MLIHKLIAGFSDKNSMRMEENLTKALTLNTGIT